MLAGLDLLCASRLARNTEKPFILTERCLPHFFVQGAGHQSLTRSRGPAKAAATTHPRPVPGGGHISSRLSRQLDRDRCS
jgi:hypothetical protein